MTENGLPLSPRRKTTVEIPLHSVRKYVPGSGPPPPRISLVPPRDSTAYIIDQFVLPPDKDMTAASRRLIHYHIGFTDLPAVKILIPCNEILDYVSPRELEDWEYRNLEKKEEERARRLAEKQRLGPTTKQSGRPRKVPMEDVGMLAKSSVDEALLLAQQVAGPSLSTPQKRKLGLVLHDDMGDTSNMESDDAAIYRQLQEDAESDDIEFEGEIEANSEAGHQLALEYDTPDIEAHSQAGSLAQPLQDLCSASSAAAPAETSLSNSVPATALPISNIPNPRRIHPAWASAFGLTQQNSSENMPKAHSQNGSAQQNGMPRPVLAKSQQPKPSTPIPIPEYAFRTSNTTKDPSAPPVALATGASTVVASDSSTSKRKGQPKGDSQEQQHKTKKRKVKQEDVPAPDEWEVKELLDDQWVIEQGVRVHRYLVLWVGDWPEDQNPTWEPAENVQDKDLIKRYQKKKKAGLLKPRKKPQKTLHQYLAKTNYSSVAEAFEGELDEQMGPATAVTVSDPYPPNETLLVTETVGDITSNGTKPGLAPSFGSFDSVLARYNQSFSHG